MLTATGLFVGLWATFAPRSFYDSFPGAGRRWVSIDGPFNEHLVRDVGSLNLALALVAAIAAVTLGIVVVRAAAGAWLVYSVPHLAYHLHHLADMEAIDAAGNVVTLSASVVIPVVILVFAGPRGGRTGSSSRGDSGSRAVGEDAAADGAIGAAPAQE